MLVVRIKLCVGPQAYVSRPRLVEHERLVRCKIPDDR